MSGTLNSHALANAACIGLQFGARTGGSFLVSNIDEIKKAAEALAQHENKPGFSWDDQAMMWEELCDLLAARVGVNSDESVSQWHETIRLHLKAARTAQLGRGRK